MDEDILNAEKKSLPQPFQSPQHREKYSASTKNGEGHKDQGRHRVIGDQEFGNAPRINGSEH